MKKKTKKPRKVTVKDLDEWAKHYKDALLYGKGIARVKWNKVDYIGPIEFEGVVE